MSDSGQNDIILGPPLTENALRSPALAKWSRQADFVKAPKSAWHVGADPPATRAPSATSRTLSCAAQGTWCRVTSPCEL